MQTVIRRARLPDLPSIVRLIGQDPLGASTEATGSTLPASYAGAFAAIDDHGDCDLVVLEQDGRVVGTLQLYCLPFMSFHGAWVAHVESVHVDPAYQGQGLGTQLMRWAMAQARQKGCHRMQLTSRKTRVDAHRFYAKLGFESSHEGMKLQLGGAASSYDAARPT